MPLKLTSGAIAGITTIIWSSPSILTENPIISEFLDNYRYTNFYISLTLFWLITLVFMIEIFFIAKNQEHKYEKILNDFKDKEFQYNMFSNFINDIKNKKNFNDLSFFRKDFEKFIFEEIIRNHKIKNHKLFGVNKSYKINVYINELLPKLSDMIINRAIEQNIIAKSDEAIWEEKYVVIAPDAFDN